MQLVQAMKECKYILLHISGNYVSESQYTVKEVSEKMHVYIYTDGWFKKIQWLN